MTTQRSKRRLMLQSVATVSALGLLAAACGDDSDDSEGPDDNGATADSVDVEVFQENIDAFDALEQGRVDAVALTSFTIVYETDQMDGFEATEGFIPVIDGEEQIGCGAFGFDYDDAALRNAFNAELADMQEAGEVLPIIEEFGFNEAAVETAAEQTANDLAGGAYDGLTDEYNEDDLEDYRDSGVVIGIAPEPPYGYEEGGDATGAAPELARAIFDRLDIEVTDYTVTEFGGLVGGLEAGRMDVISAGMFINDERAENVLFANPDYCATTAFAVPEGNPDDLSDFESVAEAGITLGVVSGTVEVDYAQAVGD